MAYHVYTTRGFVLTSSPQGEADKFLKIFTEELGLINTTAKSARNVSSKLRSHLNSFSLINCSLVRGKNYWKITSASESQDFFSLFRLDSKKRVLFGRIFSILLLMLNGEEKNRELFAIVESCLEEIKTQDFSEEELDLIEIVVVSRILHNLGFLDSKSYSGGLFESPINPSILEETRKSKRDLVLGINEALKASQ